MKTFFYLKSLKRSYMLEIKLHDGPARLGKYGELETPTILRLGSSLTIIKDEPMPYDVPKPLAEFSVDETIQHTKKSQQTGIAVVHGSKYPDLRIYCAEKLEELGNHVLMIANSEELLTRPKDMINIIVHLRENVNPNTALYFPFIKTPFIPLLAYLGIDFFGDVSGDFYAQLGMLMTPTNIYDQKYYHIYDFNTTELGDYNKKTIDFVLREVRENIRNGTLRNLVEERCCSSPEAMSALRILDRDYDGFLDKYTQIY